MRDYEISKGLPSREEVWAKLAGTTPAHETVQAYKDIVFANFQKAIDEAMLLKARSEK